MYTAQLIKREEKVLYLNENNEVVSLKTDKEKIAHQVMGKETKTIVVEEVETRFRGRTKGELDSRFWAYMESEKLDGRNYYLIIDK